MTFFSTKQNYVIIYLSFGIRKTKSIKGEVMLPKGVYIVKAGDRVVKAIVK